MRWIRRSLDHSSRPTGKNNATGRFSGKHASPLLEMARIVALTHHEKWDGSGYPHRLQGEQIPLVGRIVALADVFDALTTERPYKKAWPVEQALATIRSERGRHFDPRITDAFFGVVPEILRIRQQYAETGAEAAGGRPGESVTRDDEARVRAAA